VELYHQYSFTGVDRGFAFAYDTLHDWEVTSQRAMLRLYDAVDALRHAGDIRLAAQEHEFAEKMAACWRVRGEGTLYEPDDAAYSCHDAEQAVLLRPHLRARKRDYLRWLTHAGADVALQLFQDGLVVLDRGKGAPYWAAGSDKDVTLAYGRIAKSCSTFAELERYMVIAGAASLPFCQTSYIRVQSARKETPGWRLVGDRLEPAAASVKARVRRIGAQPFAVNHLWAGVGAVLRHVMAVADHRNTGIVTFASGAAAAWPEVVAFDLASYDTTVSLETLTTIREELLEPVLGWLAGHGVISHREYTLLLTCDERTQAIPILVPPSNTLVGAELVEAAGQTRSGENLTSWKGTEINRARIAAKAQQLQLRYGVDYAAFNYGDDTLMMFEHSANADRWADAAAFAGFTETVAADTTFLMRRLPQGYSYLGRMVAACVNREQRSEPFTALAAGAAMATRYELLAGHPQQAQFYPILEDINDSARWKEALSIAKGGGRAAQLTLAAAKQQIVQYPQSNLDDVRQQLSSLGATSEATELAVMVTEARRALRWVDFQDAAAKLTMRDAEKMIADRSYRLEHSSK